MTAPPEDSREVGDDAADSCLPEAPVGCFRLDARGVIVGANDALARIIGAPSAGSMIGRPLSAFARPPGIAWLLDVVAHRGPVTGMPLRLRRQDGVEIACRVSAMSLARPAGWFAGSVEDVTCERDAELAMQACEVHVRRTETLDALRRLGGAIAHDINNIMTALTGNLELALLRLPPGAELRADLERVQSAAERALLLARDLADARNASGSGAAALAADRAVSSAPLLRAAVGGRLRVVPSSSAAVPLAIQSPGLFEDFLFTASLLARDMAPPGAGLVITLDVGAGVGPAGLRICWSTDEPPSGNLGPARPAEGASPTDRRVLDSLAESLEGRVIWEPVAWENFLEARLAIAETARRRRTAAPGPAAAASRK